MYRLADVVGFDDPGKPHFGLAVPLDSPVGTVWLLTSRRCGMCQNPLRREVEEAVVAGASFGAAARQFPDAGVSERQVRWHFRRGHHPMAWFAVRWLRQMQMDASARRLVARLEGVGHAEEFFRPSDNGGDV